MKKFKLSTRRYLKGTVSVISSDPPCKHGNGQLITIPLKACLIKYKLDINVCNLKNGCFQLGFLYRSDMRVFLLHIIDQIKVSRVPLYRCTVVPLYRCKSGIRHCYLCMESHIKLRCQFLKKIFLSRIKYLKSLFLIILDRVMSKNKLL